MPHTKIYIINIKKDILKKKHMIQECKKKNLQYTFIDAIDGNTLSQEEIQYMVDNNLTQKHYKRKLFKAEIGCLLSHISIYKKMLKENISYALILEDDININSDIIPFLNCIDRLNFNWEVILLGCHNQLSLKSSPLSSFWAKEIKVNSFTFTRPCTVVEGAYAYLINLKGAKKMIDATIKKKIFQPIDHYICSDKYSNIYMLKKPIIYIDDYLTENFSTMAERNNFHNNIKLTWRNFIFIWLNLPKLPHIILAKMRLIYHYLKPVKPYRQIK